MAPAYYDRSDDDYDDPPPRRYRRQQQPPSRGDSPSPEPQLRRRKSILKDPSDGPKRSRSGSQVRVRSPSEEKGYGSDDSSNGWWIKHKDGRKEFVHDNDPRAASMKSRASKPTGRHDLENKSAPRNKQFREKRDGYESDEGETLRKEKGRRSGYGNSRGDSRDGMNSKGAALGGAAAGALAGGSAGAAHGRASSKKLYVALVRRTSLAH